MDFIRLSRIFVIPIRNRTAKHRTELIFGGRYGRTIPPRKRKTPRIPLLTKLMISTMGNRIFILLLPYAKLARKASTERVDARITASSIIMPMKLSALSGSCYILFVPDAMRYKPVLAVFTPFSSDIF